MFPMIMGQNAKGLVYWQAATLAKALAQTNRQPTNGYQAAALFQDLKEGGTLMKSMNESSVCSRAAASIQRLVGAPAPHFDAKTE